MSAEPRIGPLPRTQWDPRTSAILEQMPLRSGDQPLGIFTTLAHHPPLMRAFMELGDFLLTKGAPEHITGRADLVTLAAQATLQVS
jgi:hypothetical protein